MNLLSKRVIRLQPALKSAPATVLLLAVILGSVGALAKPGVEVHAVLSPAGHFTAKSDQVKGSAVLMHDTVQAHNISVPLDSLQSGIGLRDKHMKEKYLETQKYPDAVLTEAHGDHGKGTGKLKIHGIEKPVSGTYTINGNELEAKFSIKLSDYGITGIKYMGVGVKDDAEVVVVVPVTSK